MKKNLFYLSLIFIIFVLTINSYSFEKKERIDVLYFHATIRCEGCLTIESNINKSINNLYAKELKDSSITLQSIDFLQLENEHFQDDYKFDSQTLILSKKVNGKEVKWKNLEKIWDYAIDYDKFQNYINEEIELLLK